MLETIQSPEDLRQCDESRLGDVCTELREYMIDCCATNPGHLGSSLGAVELIVGMHYVYHTPEDKLVFDVSHQAYAHKILTGRREAFRNNRKKGGISGFTRMDESPYDAFGAGHASTSISAALGYAAAAKMKGGEEKVIALIGDGALTGGMAYEGLNNAGMGGEDILIILNDNNISIDKAIGAVHNYLLKITSSRPYNQTKDRLWNLLGEGGFRRFIQKVVRTTKTFFVRSPKGGFFESMGFRYFGPIDGNNISEVVNTLRKMRNIKGPKLLHAITTKGKGYTPAEEDQTTWHAPGLFDAVSGKRTSSAKGRDRYQDVFGEVLLQLARQDKRVVGITPAMASGCGMNLLAEQMPERFYDVGIAEEHAVTFSAGLCAGGMIPFCNIYSSFSQRAYDQIIHDCALQRLPVIFCFDRAGLVGEDGATHHGTFDMAAYRSIPNVVVAAPSDERELKNMMFAAVQHKGGPYIIRYPRGYGEGVEWREAPVTRLEPGKGRIVVEAECPVANIVAEGPCVGAAVRAAAVLKEEGVLVRVVDIRFLKPLDETLLAQVVADCPRVLTVEDGCLKGGLYGAVCEWAAGRTALGPASAERDGAEESASRDCPTPLHIDGLGIPDAFIPQGTQQELRHDCGIDADGIIACVKTFQSL
ncbi:MAG: 1-deoxy-D-xylulose-5-phosphate synthase [Bacteroidales bacterium]|nr:1-deoxy-D-xylulose-5-phosphate synthase [Bacteroidales bacterium]